jgi:biotin carboxyl carrier protein
MAVQRFFGLWNDNERKIEVERQGSGHYSVSLDGEQHDVDAVRFETGNWSLIIDGQSYDVELEQTGPAGEGKYNVLTRGHVFALSIQDERRIRMAQTAKRHKVRGPQLVRSPMPGKVVKVLVAAGDEVAEDQPVIVIEAMKMENELFAPTRAKVAKIYVEEGQAVDANAELLELSEIV